MLTCVIGLPLPACMGFALISIVDLDAASDVLSALGAATFKALDALEPSSFLIGAAFTVMSLEADRWGMFRMSLYFACLCDS